MPKILVVGSINMDLALQMERVPGPGETVFGADYAFIPGGKGANQAVAAARLGAETGFCGRVGNDANGKTLLQGLSGENVDITNVTVEDTLPTGLAVIPVEANGQNRIVVFPGANGAVKKADVDRALCTPYDVVLLQLEIPLETVFYACEAAKEKGLPVVLDAGPSMSLPLEKLRGITIISPNESEAFALTGIRADTTESAAKAAARIAESCAAQYVVIKLGARGALLFCGGQEELFPAHDSVIPVDTTAAGDAFTAAMTLKWLETGDIRAAIRYANAAGALTVSKKGALPSLPRAEEIDNFLL